MEPYNLRNRIQTRAHRPETQEETQGPAQSVPTTRSDEDRSTDRQTDRQITHQTGHNTTQAALHMVVVSTPSGTLAHAQEEGSKLSSSSFEFEFELARTFCR